MPVIGESEKGFPALTTPSQTACHHQIHFSSLNVQTEQTEGPTATMAAAVGDKLLYRDGGERDRGRRVIQSLVQPFT